MDWSRLEQLRSPKSLCEALERLGVFRIEVVRRELREGQDASWIGLPMWLKGSHDFLDKVQANEVGAEILRKTRQQVQEESDRLQGTVFRMNGLGLTEISVPMTLAGDRLGFVRVSGLVTEVPLPGDVVLEERLKVLMLAGQELREVIDHWRKLPVFNEEKRAIVIQMLELLVREVVKFFEEDLAAKEREAAVQRHTFNQMVTSHSSLRQLLRKVPSIAESHSTVLIVGESGVGRELLAKMIHERSQRSSKLFRTLHCASVAENFLEAELLGYEKAAFAGAYQTKQGLVETCEGGTLYLKEIGDLSLAMQLKVLKIIKENAYTRLGGNELLKSNVRVIASTQRNLKRLVDLGTFREDLYFSLNVVELEIPPLRFRKDDIGLLAEHFLQNFSKQMNKPGVQWKEETLGKLRAHSFPGNVRELRNEVERLVAVKEPHSLIEISDLNSKIIDMLSPIEEIEKGGTLKAIVDEFEKRIISEALAKYHWNKSRVAELFQITRQGLMKKISKHKLDKRRQSL